jgi:quinol monooxygenase YgiN
MNQMKSLTAAIVLGCAFLFASSCNNDSEKTTETATSKDSSGNKPAEAAAPVMTHMLVVKHKVADFTKWKAVYDADDTARVAYGIHNYVVGRSLKDSNVVFLAMKVDNVAKAKEFAARPALKAAMQKGGVIGAPEISYRETWLVDTANNPLPVRVMVTHMVKDWDAWKKEFDSHKQVRVDAGMVDRAIGYDADNNKKVTVVGAYSDMAKAEAFLTSKDLKDKMTAAGVEGVPDIFYYRIVQRY